MTEIKNPYPEELVEESSGVNVRTNAHYIWEDGYKAGQSNCLKELKGRIQRILRELKGIYLNKSKNT